MLETESTASPDGVEPLVARVDHYGPSEAYIGGMGSVIRTFRQERLGARRVEGHATWIPASLPQILRVWLGALWSVLWLPRGTVVHVHVSEGGSLVRKGAILWVARLRGLACVATVHGHGFDAFGIKYRRLLRATLGAARVVTVLSEDTRIWLSELLPGVLVVEAENPVQPDEIVVDAGERPAVALFAGEIGPRKGVDVLLSAWPLVREQVPEATLLLAGPLAIPAPPAAEGCRYLGELAPDSVRQEIRAARLVVLPSRAEARPMVLLEAAACARPFVATPVGSVPTLARSGGILVGVGEVNALADSLIRLLRDPEAASALGRDAYTAAQARSPRQVGDAFGRLYQHALGAPPSSQRDG